MPSAAAHPTNYGTTSQLYPEPVDSKWWTEKWETMLQQYYIECIPQKAIKGQALANFIAAHLVPGNSPLAADLPNEEVMTIEL